MRCRRWTSGSRCARLSQRRSPEPGWKQSTLSIRGRRWFWPSISTCRCSPRPTTWTAIESKYAGPGSSSGATSGFAQHAYGRRPAELAPSVISKVAGVASARSPAYRLSEELRHRIGHRCFWLHSPKGQNELLRDWARRRGRVSSTEAADLIDVSVLTAGRWLAALAADRLLLPSRPNGTGRRFRYRPAPDSETGGRSGRRERLCGRVIADPGILCEPSVVPLRHDGGQCSVACHWSRRQKETHVDDSTVSPGGRYRFSFASRPLVPRPQPTIDAMHS